MSFTIEHNILDRFNIKTSIVLNKNVVSANNFFCLFWAIDITANQKAACLGSHNWIGFYFNIIISRFFYRLFMLNSISNSVETSLFSGHGFIRRESQSAHWQLFQDYSVHTSIPFKNSCKFFAKCRRIVENFWRSLCFDNTSHIFN